MKKEIEFNRPSKNILEEKPILWNTNPNEFSIGEYLEQLDNMNKNTFKFEDNTSLGIIKGKDINNVDYIGIALENNCADTFYLSLNKKELAVLIDNLKLYL